MPELAKLISDATAVLAWVSVLSNPIGTDGADALIQVFEQNTKLRTLLGIEEGVNELNLSEKNVDPGQAKILAAELKASRAVVNEVNVSQNRIGIEGGKALANVIPECLSLRWIVVGKAARIPVHNSEVTSIDASGQDLGPGEVTVLAAAISTDAAVLKKIVLDGNGDLTIDRSDQRNPKWDYSGFNALCASTKSSQLTSLSLQSCKIQGNALNALADAIKFMAALTKLAVGSNFLLGNRDIRSQEEFDAHGDHMPCDYEGFNMLCESLQASPLTEVDLSDCRLDATATTTLAKAIELMAAVKKVVLSNNFIFGSKDSRTGSILNKIIHDVDADQSGWSALCDALPGSPVEQLIVADVGMGVTGVTSLAKAISSMAVLASLTVSGNPLTGATCDMFGNWSNIDSDMSGFVALCAVLGKLTEVNLSDCHLGPTSTGELAKVFSDADAVLEEVNLAFNKIGAEGGAALVQAFKTSNIKF
eukprot:COSAG01_NODE_527_length_15894_cov_55.365622_1_plen_476_part_10